MSPITVQVKQHEDGKLLEHSDEGYKAAFVEMAKALSAGDMDAGAAALKSFFEIIDSGEDEMEGE